MPININFLIRILKMLDPQVFAPLQKYIGKTGEIHCTDLSYSVFFEITSSNIVIQPYIENPDIIIKGKTFDLFSLLLSNPSKSMNSTFVKHDICISGVPSILAAIHKSIRQIDIDWEGHLAQLTGDIAAFSIGKTLRKANQWVKNFTHHRIQDVTLYLQEEKKILPTQYELEDFYEQVDALLEATERLEQRINEHRDAYL